MVVGLVLAAVLATVLYSGGSHCSSPAPLAITSGGTPMPPGLDAASANLLDLTPVAPGALAAPDFHLVDQNGQPTSLAQFRGKVVVWSLNDDRCVDLCTLFAEDVVAADRDLGAAANDVVFVGVNTNPFYPAPSDVKAWSTTNDLEGLPNWVYVSFWASTCSLCAQEMPELQKVDTGFHGLVNFVGVDVADPSSSALASARRVGAEYPLVADPAGTTAADYRVSSLPVTFIVAPGGRILARHDGALTFAQLAAVLEMDFQNLPGI